MNATYRVTASFFSASAMATVLAACSPVGGHAGETADAGSASAVHESDPCKLLDLASIRRALPGAGDGVRDHRADDIGLASCVWQSPKGRIVLQTGTGAPQEPKELVGLVVTGNLDPRPGRQDPIRYESLPGIGDHAVAVVEEINAEKGILGSIAAAGVQKGDRKLTLMTSLPSAPEHRQATLDALRQLVSAASGRL